MQFPRRKRLILRWGTSKRIGQTEPDWLYSYPALSHDAHLLHSLTESESFKKFVDLLQRRGYDISTLRLEVNMTDKALDQYQSGERQ